LVINLKTAKTMGVDLLTAIRLRAEEGIEWAFGNAGIDGREVTLWVKSDRLKLSFSSPLLLRKRPNRCVALSDATGHKPTNAVIATGHDIF
jgi:hypothetical protein